jgi:hypothetical protein
MTPSNAPSLIRPRNVKRCFLPRGQVIRCKAGECAESRRARSRPAGSRLL